MLQVRIGNLVFEDTPNDYENAYLTTVEGFKGWWGGVSFRRESIEYPAAHGRVDTPGYLGERLVSLTGTILASSPEKLEHKKNALVGALGFGESGRLTVESEGREEWADVRLVSLPEPVDKPGNTADFLVQWCAANPFIYGEANVSEPASSVVAYHRGNSEAWPVVTVSGAAAGGYTISGPNGRSVRVTLPLQAGKPHRIDFRTGGLFIGATRQVRAFGAKSFWSIPSGQQIPMTVSGGLLLTVETTNTRV